MKQLRHLLPLLALVSYIGSIFFYESAKAWMSVSMISFLILTYTLHSPKSLFRLYLQRWALPAISLSVVCLLAYYIHSDNTAYFWNRIVLKVPILLLPLAFAGVMPLVTKKWYHLLITIFILLTTAVAAFVMVRYLFNYEAINQSYLKAKVIPTPLNHVRFSIMAAMATFLAYDLSTKTSDDDHFLQLFRNRIFWLTLTACLFIFVHIYSVRSGLIALYGALALEGWRQFRRGNQRLLLYASISVVTIIIIAWFVFPTLQNKWLNTIEDISIYLNKGYPNFNSLTTRLISFDAAWHIFKENPWFGCGVGDVKDATDAYFRTYYPEVETPILPHNQFLLSLASTGIIGLLLFVGLFFAPVWSGAYRKNRILMVHYVILFLSFMTEPMLETQLGVGYSILWILLPMTQSEETA